MKWKALHKSTKMASHSEDENLFHFDHLYYVRLLTGFLCNRERKSGGEKKVTGVYAYNLHILK